MEGLAVTDDSRWTGRRVLVTGGTGMVGSWLVRRLVDEGAYVVCLVRDADPQSELVRSGAIGRTSVVEGRLEDADTVLRAVNEHDVEVVFHLAAQTIVGTAHRSPRQTFEANVQGTWNVLEAARLLPDLVRAVVIASSDKAYGAQLELPYREDTPLSGVAPYEVSKSCTDLISRSYALTYGTPVTIARCGNIYGGGDLNWSRIVPGTIRSLLQGQTPVLRSDGTFKRDYLYVEDVVEAYVTLAEGLLSERIATGESFNFSDEDPLTVLEIYAAVCASCDRPGTEPIVLDAAVGEIHDQFLDASKAREQLGWRITVGLEEGLSRTVGWYRDLLGVRT